MKKDIRLLVARKMPILFHKLPGCEFDIQNSEVVKWLLNQPEILKFIFDKVAKEEIVYNADTGTWQGADYKCDSKRDILKDVPYHVGEYNKPKPSCYDPCDNYNGRYTKCRGGTTPNSFAENDCNTCCWLQTYQDEVGIAEEGSFEY